MAVMEYSFSSADSQKAFGEWGANCGPNALAFALGASLDEVRALLPGFDAKRYTNPSMMRDALRRAERPFISFKPDTSALFDPEQALVRVQWTGPWTAPNASPRWAYRQTHWIVTWLDDAHQMPCVFDCNSGMLHFDSWQAETVPTLTKSIPRADGGWFPTHIWRLVARPDA